MSAERYVFEFRHSVDPTALVEHLKVQGLVRDYLMYRNHTGEGETIVALNSRARVRVSRDVVELDGDQPEKHSRVRAEDPLKQVERALADVPLRNWTAYGYIGFDLARFYFDYRKDTGYPSLFFMIPETELRIARDSVRVTTALPAQVWKDVLDAARKATRHPQSATPPQPGSSDHQEYVARVQTLIGWIQEGKLQKAILSRRVEVPGELDVLGTYLNARDANNAARSFCFELSGVRGVGFSPELFLEATSDGQVITNPLAGTRPRGGTLDEDQRVRAELVADSKEVKEHAMSVRLAQEEMSRVCHAETVRIYDFMDVKQFRCVQHLSSRVSGQLKAGFTTWDAAKILFPAITVSGVDKAAALKAIGQLEEGPRGVYGGAVGWIDQSGAADLCLAIRSVYGYDQRTVLNAGAGIVAESRPEMEYMESVNKMKTMATHVTLASS
ncbi:MAG TPA: salicylate synthase [Polyangiaceae bacterium]|nr:salicylate synthase [Polyangiaceae bacterium]